MVDLERAVLSTFGIMRQCDDLSAEVYRLGYRDLASDLRQASNLIEATGEALRFAKKSQEKRTLADTEETIAARGTT